jgi:hypothetical protein
MDMEDNWAKLMYSVQICYGFELDMFHCYGRQIFKSFYYQS